MATYRGYRGGPVGYGNPDDRTISDAERGTLFCKFVQEKLLFDLCAREWHHWRACIRVHQGRWIPSRKCKAEFALVTDCQNTLIRDPEKFKELEEEYIQRRAEFRRTGVGLRYFTKERLQQVDAYDELDAK